MPPAAYAHPLFFPLAPWLARLPERPDHEAVAALAGEAGLMTESGLPVRFVAPQADGLGYEARIWAKGEVETRRDNWHDFFNALVWFSFPRAKAALNARHIREMGSADAPRGAPRDAMTHFDECGMVVVSANPALLDALRAFDWKALFVAARAEVERDMQWFLFGHATYEQLLQPFRGMTAKAVLLAVSPDWLALPLSQRLADLDARLAADLAAGLHGRPRELQPVPLLGIPGATPDNADPGYYDDTWQFRPGRRERRV